MSTKAVSSTLIEKKIFIIREHKVMLDKDLAELYDIGTRDLNKAVTRNIDRFPEDFMFRLNNDESRNLMFQIGTSSWGGTRKLPRVFTEQGVAMLSSVLNSRRAIQVNIAIMRTFTKLRSMIESHRDLKQKIDSMEKQYDKQFRVVFTALRQLLEEPPKSKKSIGFHSKRRK